MMLVVATTYRTRKITMWGWGREMKTESHEEEDIFWMASRLVIGALDRETETGREHGRE